VPPPAPVVLPSIAPVVPGVAPAGARVPPPPPAAAAPSPGPTSPNLTIEQLTDLELRTSQLDTLDYYELLKVPPEAGPAEIKKAFYRESRAYHPDRFYQLQSKELKERVNELFKRVTEAYYVLRDDTRRRKYTQDITGPERAQKLRFTESSEAETKIAAKKEQEEQIGTHPKGRQFFQTGMTDFNAQRWAAAERNFKMALTYEPSNARYKEKLLEVQKTLNEESKSRGDSFKIK
jgi:curved DNA-binding protein CbpA